MSGATSTARHLTFGDALTIGLAAMVGAGVFGVWGPAVASAGNWLLPALAVAALVAWCNASSSAQLAARHPGAGGGRLLGRLLLGRLRGRTNERGMRTTLERMKAVVESSFW